MQRKARAGLPTRKQTLNQLAANGGREPIGELSVFRCARSQHGYRCMCAAFKAGMPKGTQPFRHRAAKMEPDTHKKVQNYNQKGAACEGMASSLLKAEPTTNRIRCVRAKRLCFRTPVTSGPTLRRADGCARLSTPHLAVSRCC